MVSFSAEDPIPSCRGCRMHMPLPSCVILLASASVFPCAESSVLSAPRSAPSQPGRGGLLRLLLALLVFCVLGEIVIDLCRDDDDDALGESTDAASCPFPQAATRSEVAVSGAEGASPLSAREAAETATEEQDPRKAEETSSSTGDRKERSRRRRKRTPVDNSLRDVDNILRTDVGADLVKDLREKMAGLFGSPPDSVQALRSTGHIVCTLPTGTRVCRLLRQPEVLCPADGSL